MSGEQRVENRVFRIHYSPFTVTYSLLSPGQRSSCPPAAARLRRLLRAPDFAAIPARPVPSVPGSEPAKARAIAAIVALKPAIESAFATGVNLVPCHNSKRR